MKKLSITDSEKKLLFIVLALAILAASYFFGFTKLNEAAAVIEASNERDAAEVSKLEGMVAKQAETEAETKSYQKGIQDVIDKYPSNIKQDKAIFLVQQLQDEIQMDIGTISFSMNKHVQNVGSEGTAGKYALLSMSYNCDYDQLKTFLKYVGELPDRTTLPNITASYDETSGRIKGNISYKMYYLTNSGKKYVDYPDMEDYPDLDIPAGKAGIFYQGDWYPLQEYDEMMAELEAQLEGQQ